MKKKILILDDDIRFRSALTEELQDRGHEVTAVGSFSELENLYFDRAILDLRLLGESGLSAIPHLLKENHQCHILMLTGYGSVATAVEAIKLGAINYLQKPASIEMILEGLEKKEASQVAEPLESKKVSTLQQHEHEYIEYLMTQNKGNISKTAQQLGLHRQSLQRKLKKFPGN